MAKISTLEQAPRYLDEHYLPWWNKACTVEAANSEDAHRPLDKQQDLAAVLSHVENRQVKGDYTIQVNGRVCLIERADICTGLRGASVRVEQRRDGDDALLHRFAAEGSINMVAPSVRF